MNTVKLFSLVRKGDLNFLQEVLANDDMKSTGPNGQSLLHEAISFSKNEIAKYLIENGINVNAVCKKKQTALHYAAIYKNRHLIIKLISSGADVDLLDIYGNGPAWYAALTTGNEVSLLILKILKQNGANLERKNLAGRSVLDIYPQILTSY